MMAMLRMRMILALGYMCITQMHALTIENGVEGEPDVLCGPSSINVTFRTQNMFGGHVYAKGRFSEPSCRVDADVAPKSSAGIQITFDSCGVRRSRAVSPKGVLMTVTVLIMFHSRFMTKVDRAYYVQCFYMEAEKTLTAELEVSMFSTQLMTAQAHMPTCQYSVLENKGGQPIRYAKVGDPVHHRWTCDSPVADAYCMVVHTCNVDDGSGNTVTLIDSNGCPQDQYLLGNLEYYDDLTVGKDAHVFKYADRATVSFNCQISVALREPSFPCPRPSCPLEAAPLYTTASTLPPPPLWLNKKRSRVKRLSDTNETGEYGEGGTGNGEHTVANASGSIVDVETQSILVFDPDSRLDTSNLNRLFIQKDAVSRSTMREVCMPKALFSIYAAISLAMLVVSFLILLAVSIRRCRTPIKLEPIFLDYPHYQPQHNSPFLSLCSRRFMIKRS